jgi:hypothetical protein
MANLIISFLTGFGCGFLVHAYIHQGETRFILYSDRELSEDEAIEIIKENLDEETTENHH